MLEPDDSMCFSIPFTLSSPFSFYIFVDYGNTLRLTDGVDVRIDIVEPDGKVQKAKVEDITATDGSYRGTFRPSKSGRHMVYVYVMGSAVNESGYGFYARPFDYDDVSQTGKFFSTVYSLSLSLSLSL